MPTLFRRVPNRRHSCAAALIILFLLGSCGICGESKPAQPKAPPLLCAPPEQGLPPDSLVWIPSSASAVRGVVILTHGLNNQAAIMDSLGREVNRLGFHALRLTLAGHENTPDKRRLPDSEIWISDYAEAYCAARRDYPDLPVYSLSYSLGALVTVAFLDRYPQSGISKLVLLAPALTPTRKVFLLRLLNWLRVFGLALPSRTPPPYRNSNYTSFQAYHALLTLSDSVSELRHPEQLSRIAAALIMSPSDGVVSYSRTQDWLERNGLNTWQLVKIEPKPRIDGTRHHLIIDQDGLGEAEWARLLVLLEAVLITH